MTDAPWVGESDKTMAECWAASRGATWVVQMEKRSVERRVAALMDALWVVSRGASTADCSADQTVVMWVAQMDER